MKVLPGSDGDCKESLVVCLLFAQLAHKSKAIENNVTVQEADTSNWCKAFAKFESWIVSVQFIANNKILILYFVENELLQEKRQM